MCFFKSITFQAYTDAPQLKPDYYLAQESHEAYLIRRRETRKAATKRNIELNTAKRVIGKTDTRSKLAAELNAAYSPILSYEAFQARCAEQIAQVVERPSFFVALAMYAAETALPFDVVGYDNVSAYEDARAWFRAWRKLNPDVECDEILADDL